MLNIGAQLRFCSATGVSALVPTMFLIIARTSIQRDWFTRKQKQLVRVHDIISLITYNVTKMRFQHTGSMIWRGTWKLHGAYCKYQDCPSVRANTTSSFESDSSYQFKHHLDIVSARRRAMNYSNHKFIHEHGAKGSNILLDDTKPRTEYWSAMLLLFGDQCQQCHHRTHIKSDVISKQINIYGWGDGQSSI